MTALTTLPGRDADRVPAPAEGWCPEGTWCSAPSTTSSGTGPAGDDGHRDQGGHAAGAHSEGQGHERRRRHQLERAPRPQHRGEGNRAFAFEITGEGEKYVRDKLGSTTPDPQADHDVTALEAIAATVSDETVRGYIEEAVTCL
jgi:hypothetical protein